MAQRNQYHQAERFGNKAANCAQGKNQNTFLMLGGSARAWQATFELMHGKSVMAKKLLNYISVTFQDLKNTNRATGTFNPNKIPNKYKTLRDGWFDAIGTKLLKYDLQKTENAKLVFLCNEFNSWFTFNYW